MKKNILITSAGKRVALVRYFKETLARFFPEAKVYTTDMVPGMAPACYVSDGSFKVPHATDSSYLSTLLQLCEDHSIGMIVPTIDTELLPLSGHRDWFRSKGINVIVCDEEFVSVCRDKRVTRTFFNCIDFPVPGPIDIENPVFPLFARPYDGSRSINSHYIKSADELTQAIVSDPKMIFVEYIDKSKYKEFTVDMYYGADNSVKCIIPRERIEVRDGEICKGRTHKDFLVDYIKRRFDHVEGCIGPLCLQLFYDEARRDVIGIEINPRFGGGYPLSYMAGGNYPEMLIREYFLGESISYRDDWKDGMLMLRFDDAVFA